MSAPRCFWSALSLLLVLHAIPPSKQGLNPRPTKDTSGPSAKVLKKFNVTLKERFQAWLLIHVEYSSYRPSPMFSRGHSENRGRDRGTWKRYGLRGDSGLLRSHPSRHGSVTALHAKDPIHSSSQARPGRWSSLPLDIQRSKAKQSAHEGGVCISRLLPVPAWISQAQVEEAKRLNANTIDTAHILLALLKEADENRSYSGAERCWQC